MLGMTRLIQPVASITKLDGDYSRRQGRQAYQARKEKEKNPKKFQKGLDIRV